MLNDPHGYLGTDTGGKVATLRAMEESGKLDPDIGYWAERWDPDGRVHPLYFTSHLEGKWVNATTLPALYAAYPLFRVAGYRGALLVPMLGSVLAALAARALARRLGGGEGWAAFWVVGLASPVAIYALDFWEHSLGVALMTWGVVLLLDVTGGSAARPWPGALAAGLLFGTAATMRTEALVYGAVATSIAAGTLLWRHRGVLAPLAVGVAALAGLAAPLLANAALEEATIGTGLRATRATQTVIVAGQADESRVEEAVLTAVGLEPGFSPDVAVAGIALVALLVLAARRGSEPLTPTDARLVRIALVGVAALYLLRFAMGPGFIPGMIAATPLAAAGLAWAWRATPSRAVAGVALAALPLVWMTQFTGGAAPQWAGRYILTSGLLLGVVGVVALARFDRRVAGALVLLSTVVTAFGLGWLSLRSHDVAASSRELARRPEPVLVSTVAHLFREAGWYAADRRWLTAVTREELATAVGVVQEAGFDRFGLITLDQGPAGPPLAVAGFTPAGADRIEFLDGVELTVTTYVTGGP